MKLPNPERERYIHPKRASIHDFVIEFVESLPDLTGKVVVDVPAGDGQTSQAFKQRGATVKALDLYPEFVDVEGIEVIRADLAEDLPIADASVDILICQEGIEHLPDKLRMFREFNRVLRKGGKLIITAPNISHFRGRLSMFFVESDLWRRLAPNEMDSVWMSDEDSDRIYFGHLFLVGVHHLLAICALCGFETEQRRWTKISGMSVALGIIFYPLLALVTLRAYCSYQKHNRHVEKATCKEILWRRVRLNLSPRTLLCRNIFWVLRKDRDLSEAHEAIRRLTRGL